jgi:hypothetical protein
MSQNQSKQQKSWLVIYFLSAVPCLAQFETSVIMLVQTSKMLVHKSFWPGLFSERHTLSIYRSFTSSSLVWTIDKLQCLWSNENSIIRDICKIIKIKICTIGWLLFWKFWTIKKLIKPLKDIHPWITKLLSKWL